jgi:hypothetical protein
MRQRTRGWQYRGLVTVRMLYLMFAHLTGWMVLLAATSASNDAEVPALRREMAMLRQQTPQPNLSWADPPVLAALARLAPCRRPAVTEEAVATCRELARARGTGRPGPARCRPQRADRVTGRSRATYAASPQATDP